MPLDLYIPPDALEVILDVFEGPIDLLLYLIRRHNLDVLDIPMAELCRQYIKADAVCTDASVHDSQVLDTVLRDAAVGGKTVWADSAYRSDEQEQRLGGSQHESQIHERAYRNKPLSEAQEISNTAKSRVRARVEHVFGHMENSMGGIFLRSIGAARAKTVTGKRDL